jgi:hypothetical protein
VPLCARETVSGVTVGVSQAMGMGMSGESRRSIPELLNMMILLEYSSQSLIRDPGFVVIPCNPCWVRHKGIHTNNRYFPRPVKFESTYDRDKYTDYGESAPSELIQK